ncbi:hypothetical protein LSAT2_005542 [Lamellibrachia satsuma]|nr:hypothetical protein LSAT2_005542 [Lamellibrachia satsuma]
MGGWMSSQRVAAPTPQSASQKPSKPEDNVVIIPVDGSRQADMAFAWYMDHVHRPENKVHIVHGHEVEYPSGEFYPDYAIPPEEWTAKIKQAEDDGLNLIKRYEDKLKELQINGDAHSQVGPPGHVIVSSADNLNASMIVMGTRGMGLLRRTILGSVSDYVIHHTKLQKAVMTIIVTLVCKTMSAGVFVWFIIVSQDGAAILDIGDSPGGYQCLRAFAKTIEPAPNI